MFTVVTAGPRSALAARVVHGWQSLQSQVIPAPLDASVNLGACASALLLADNRATALACAATATASLMAQGLCVVIGVLHGQPRVDSSVWDAAIELNRATGAPVVLPVNGTRDTQAALVRSFASALTGWGAYTGFDVADLVTISKPPCIGIFGKWTPSSNAGALAETFGLLGRPPVRGALLTVTLNAHSALQDVHNAVETLASHLAADADLLFTTNMQEAPTARSEALLTLFYGRRSGERATNCGDSDSVEGEGLADGRHQARSGSGVGAAIYASRSHPVGETWTLRTF